MEPPLRYGDLLASLLSVSVPVTFLVTVTFCVYHQCRAESIRVLPRCLRRGPRAARVIALLRKRSPQRWRVRPGPFQHALPPGAPRSSRGPKAGAGGRRLYATGTSFVSAASRLSLLGSLIADPESPHPAIRCIIISDPWAEPESLLTPALSVTCCLFNSEQLFLPRPQPQSFLLRQTLIIQKLGREYF